MSAPAITDLVALPEHAEKLEQYLALLIKWNKAYNLTAITERDAIIVKHLADSLATSEFLHGDSIIDIGTGAGLPGIPLAIINPDKQFCLLDSNGKKVRFLKQAIQQLGLKNVQAVQSRVEEYQPEQGYSSIISRAFASVCDMLHGSQHLLSNNGRFLAMKGMQPDQECQQLPAGFHVEAIHHLQVEGLVAARCIVEISKDS